MKLSLSPLVAIAAVFSSSPISAHAESIGIKFADAEDVPFGAASAGAPGFAQENWNFVLTDWSGNAENDALFAAGIIDSSGNQVGPTLAAISYDGQTDPVHYDAANTWRSTAGNATPDDTLMNGYLDDGNDDQPYLNLSLAADGYSSYTVVVYVNGDGQAGAIGRYWLEEWTDPLAAGTVITDRVGITSNSYAGVYELAGTFSPTATPADSDVPSGNYIVFENVTVRNLRVRSAGNGDPEDFGRGPLNAVQIIDTGNAVDSDGDGLPDYWEDTYMLDKDDNGLDPNNNGVAGDPDNGAAGNPDGDGLSNLEEFERLTNPQSGDTDGDTLADEVEDDTGVWVSNAQTGTDPRIPDSDGDGLSDGIENNSGNFISADDPGTNPNLADTDADMLPDNWEVANGFNPNSAAGDDGKDGDIDADFSPNIDELNAGTDPNDGDSDDDGLPDGYEDNGGVFVSATQTGTDPLDPDTDGDSLSDAAETATGTFTTADDTGTDPNLPDTDADFFRDDWEIANGKDPFDGVGLSIDQGGIGLNFGAGGADGTNAATASLDPAAVTGIARQANWNNLLGAAGGPVSLLDNLGVDSGATVTWTTDEEWSNGTGVDADGTLLVGWISANTGVENPITIDGIPYAGYDLVVYFNHDRGTEDVDFGESNGAFPTVRLHEGDPNVATAGALFQQVATAAGDPEQVGTFYYIPGLSATTLNLFINSAGDEGTTDRGAITGIQIIATSGALPFAITSIERSDAGPGLVDVTLTWNSEPGANYAISASNDLNNWLEIDDAGSEGASTSYTETGVSALIPRRYYRIELQ